MLSLLSLSLLLCSCATTPPHPRPLPQLPANVPMNPEAGRGGWLIVMVRVNDSEPIPCVVDTGCSVTCFDNSVQPHLGERLGGANIWTTGISNSGACYPVPKLYLGNTPLLTKPKFFLDTTPLRNNNRMVVTMNFKPLATAGHLAFRGILGMDVLKHYCIQLDFQKGQMRFLDDEEEQTNKKDWGTPYHLNDIGDGCFAISENLVGTKAPKSLIDTGAEFDGELTPASFQQWTNHETPPANGHARSPNGVLGGEIYHDLELDEWPEKTGGDSHSGLNVIGIHVLSQNLVTLDFPEHTLYLKRMSNWPLVLKDTEAKGTSIIESATDFLKSLKKKGKLPGWTKSIDATDYDVHWSHHTNGVDLVTFDEKESVSTVCHYSFTRDAQNGPWKLEKTWRTDQDDKTIKEYPSE